MGRKAAGNVEEMCEKGVKRTLREELNWFS